MASTIVVTKTCACCNLSQPLTCYHKHSRRPDGVQSICKLCANEKRRRYYHEGGGKEVTQAYQKTEVARMSDLKTRDARGLKYRRSEKGQATIKTYRGSAARKETLRKYDTGKGKLPHALRHRVREALKRHGVSKSTTTAELVGCSADFMRQHIEQQWSEGMTWNSHGQGEGTWQIDHIRPLASFDLTDPEQQKVAFHYTNQQPLWWRENLEKSDLLPDGTRGRASVK